MSKMQYAGFDKAAAILWDKNDGVFAGMAQRFF